MKSPWNRHGRQATKLASQAAAKVASSAARADGVSADDAGRVGKDKFNIWGFP